MADVSPPGSLAGWNWRTWLKKNKGAIKLIVAAGVAYVVAVSGAVANPELNAMLTGVVGLAGKLGLDVLDYWINEVPQP